MKIEFWWRQIFEILIIHKPSLGSLDVPQKIWARSVQPFWRLLDTNKQTDKQTDKPNLYIDWQYITWLCNKSNTFVYQEEKKYFKAKEERCESPVAVGKCRCKYLFDQLKILITGLKGLTFFFPSVEISFRKTSRWLLLVGVCISG